MMRKMVELLKERRNLRAKRNREMLKRILQAPK